MNLLSIKDLHRDDIENLIELACQMKNSKKKFASSLENKNLLMLFEAPSLRTRLSFEIGINQLGGHAIYYNLGDSTLGKKESVKEFAHVISRYADIVTARVYEQALIDEIAKYASITVINAMTNFEHPCQVLSDLLTIWEKKGTCVLKLAYLGDANNNVTHSLLYACAMMGSDMSIACPKNKTFMPQKNVLDESLLIAGETDTEIEITDSPSVAVKDADIVYTDTWMSYHIPKSQEKSRLKTLRPYQVNSEIMALAKKDAMFMHDLPAARGREVTDDVIDSTQSIVIDQAENRLHMQKALMVWLMEKSKK